MKKTMLLAALLMAGTSALAQTPAAPVAAPGAVVEQSNEYRFQLDLAVNQAALNKALPAGWESQVAAQGPAKDCNLRLIFIDRVNVLDGNARVLGAGKDIAVYLEAPVKQTGGAGTARVVLAGISGHASATAATFGRLVKAAKVSAARTIATVDGETSVTEDWDLTGAGGEHARLHVKYVRAPANRASADVRFLDPADPAHFVTVHTEQETDIARNVTTTPPVRVQEFSFTADGGAFDALLGASPRPLSWDSQPTYRRSIAAP
jgi:hypothetical protein